MSLAHAMHMADDVPDEVLAATWEPVITRKAQCAHCGCVLSQLPAQCAVLWNSRGEGFCSFLCSVTHWSIHG